MKIQFAIFIFLTVIICNLLAQDIEVSDISNKLFLKELDENIIGTIKILSAFNESANAMESTIKGNETLKKFLMDMTIECSKIRTQIKNSDNLLGEELEEEISWIIKNIRSDIKYDKHKIDDKKDVINIKTLENFDKGLNLTIAKIRKNIIIEEKNIIKEKQVTPKYFTMQSRHFLYSLLLNYVENGEKLSAENRDLLVYIVSLISRSLSEEPSRK
jgi:hypothetical protein